MLGEKSFFLSTSRRLEKGKFSEHEFLEFNEFFDGTLSGWKSYKNLVQKSHTRQFAGRL